MKNLIALIAVVVVASTLYFTNTSLASKADIQVNSLNGQSILNLDYDVTFNYVLKSGSTPSEGVLKVNTASNFAGTQVGSQVLSSTSSETIQNMSLSPATQYFWKIFKVSDGSDISPTLGSFTTAP